MSLIPQILHIVIFKDFSLSYPISHPLSVSSSPCLPLPLWALPWTPSQSLQNHSRLLSLWFRGIHRWPHSPGWEMGWLVHTLSAQREKGDGVCMEGGCLGGGIMSGMTAKSWTQQNRPVAPRCGLNHIWFEYLTESRPSQTVRKHTEAVSVTRHWCDEYCFTVLYAPPLWSIWGTVDPWGQSLWPPRPAQRSLTNCHVCRKHSRYCRGLSPWQRTPFIPC